MDVAVLALSPERWILIPGGNPACLKKGLIHGSAARTASNRKPGEVTLEVQGGINPDHIPGCDNVIQVQVFALQND